MSSIAMDRKRPRDQSVCGTANRSGFTLIEIMVTLLIIGLMVAIVSPNFRRRQPEYERKQFLSSLNALMRLAAQQAAVTHKLHRVYFDFERGKEKVMVQIKGEGQDEKGQQIFKTIKAPYLHSTLTWPKTLPPQSFIIEGTDELAQKTDKKIWFFIMPEGLTQNVIINVYDKNPAYRGKPKQIGLVLNPFSAQFKIYESFQK